MIYVDQAARESLSSGGNPAVAVDQAALEIVSHGGNPHIRVDQVCVELLILVGTASTRLVTVMPLVPALSLAEFTENALTQAVVSSFTGQSQAGYLGRTVTSIRLTTPPLTQSQAIAWIQWLASNRGQMALFVLPAYLEALVPAGLSSAYWRLKNGTNKWSVSEGLIYGLTFEIIQDQN